MQRSFDLVALTGAVTNDNAKHLRVLPIIDVDLSTDAMTSLGQDATAIDSYVRAVANGLPQTVPLVTGSVRPA